MHILLEMEKDQMKCLVQILQDLVNTQVRKNKNTHHQVISIDFNKLEFLKHKGRHFNQVLRQAQELIHQM